MNKSKAIVIPAPKINVLITTFVGSGKLSCLKTYINIIIAGKIAAIM